MTTSRRLLILGGGMAGLTAALRATELGHQVTVVQRGHRLGGKGASHRTAEGRIEEHGLHVWPGYYDNAFRVMRTIHDVPDGAIPGLFPAPAVGVADSLGDPWLARFGTNDRRPGIDAGELTVSDFVRQCGQLLSDLVRSTNSADEAQKPRKQVYLSGRATPRSGGSGPTSAVRTINEIVTSLFSASLSYAPRLLQVVPTDSPTVSVLIDELVRATTDLRRSRSNETGLDQMIDLVLTCLLGIYREDLLTNPDGFAAINDLDFRDWLSKHGAAATTVDSGVVRGMYDLTFGYRSGDRSQPAFEAGTGLMLAGRFFFDFKGALFWKMSAGMGDVVFAPMYQHLKSRGVRFLFFHRLCDLQLDASKERVESVVLARQANLVEGCDEYKPLVAMHDLQVFPEFALLDQLEQASVTADLESHWADRGHEVPVVLRHGQDFDTVVLATSIGMVPHVCAEILDHDQRWRDMVDNVSVVATKALQLWTSPDEQALGWGHAGSTVAGYDSRFDTYASMSHLIDVEATGQPTGAISYFCSALADDVADAGPTAATRETRSAAEHFLNHEIGAIWPNAVGPDGFTWQALVSDKRGSTRLEDQYLRANVDPSDRYVQSLPGSGKHRLRADDSGLKNLYLAGDWIDSGLNAGCIEAATIAGIQAANAACEAPLCEGVVGGWRPIYGRRGSGINDATQSTSQSGGCDE